MNDSTVTELRETERRCLRKFNARAAKLMQANPQLNIDIARGKAIEAMPNTTATFLQARSHLTMMGVRPLSFNEV
jgi:hypothetical protein